MRCFTFADLRLIGISGTSDPARDYLHLEEERYGLGQIRSREKFFDTFGINPKTRTIEGGLCRFVQGVHFAGAPQSMHVKFSPFLRYDNMGIDYTRITYRHKTPDKKTPHVDEKELAALQTILRDTIKERELAGSAEKENPHTNSS